jgi:uncharacterized protein (DUF3084 family)
LEGKSEAAQKRRKEAKKQKQEAQKELRKLQKQEKRLQEKLRHDPQHEDKSKEELRQWINERYGS